jgi:hypothetical protein
MHLRQVQESHHNRLPGLQIDVVNNEKTLIKGKTYRWDEVEEPHTHYCMLLFLNLKVQVPDLTSNKVQQNNATIKHNNFWSELIYNTYLEAT